MTRSSQSTATKLAPSAICPKRVLPGRCRSSIALPAPTPVPCALASAIASRRRTHTRRFRPFCISIPVRVTWSAAISGPCVQPAAGGQSSSRAGSGTADQPGRDGLARYRLRGVPRIAASLSAPVRSSLGSTGLCHSVAPDAEQVCNRPGPPPANDPMPVHISELDRGRAAATFDQMAQSIANYEVSAEVTTFTSKFDAVQAGNAQFTPAERLGYELFRGKAKCNNCHRDGGPGEDPLFTDFTASNLGTPANLLLPYYAEQRPDAYGYTANPAGSAYVDPGVAGFLSTYQLLSQPSSVDTRWVPLVPATQGRFQVPTLRNVDKRPYPSFVKAYAHNGYFKSIKSIVHFYNMRDVLPRCSLNDHGEGIACRPAPESTTNMNTKFMGRLGLSDEEENALVSFMQTLTDGYMLR